ncbi:MAG: phosphomethylpyrimidine synthase ThiC [Methanocellales archaeon]|nr:phosphomethylpyrimidine synthase ThiC [Methanocellales archaeon]
MTLIETARKGQITPEMKMVAQSEGVNVQKVRKSLADGRLVILRSATRDVAPVGIGELMRTKINTNVGTSIDFVDVEEEVEKALVAVKHGADTVMDLSTGGNLDIIRRRILNEVSVPVGSVPIYQAAQNPDMSVDDMFNAIRKHAADGIDFMTIHAGVTLSAVEHLKKRQRILDVVSRGGAFMVAWMMQHEQENPFYAEYDYLLEIAKEYDVPISLGDGMRPGCISDAGDAPEFTEFVTLGELVRRARSEGVQTIAEGPGHVPLDDIGASVMAMKRLTDYAPLYLLGPLVTDIGPGYDHMIGAIGGAVAGMYGADFLCMTSPAEHLALPTVEDIKDGTIVTKIAAHAADLTKDGQKDRARTWDDKMAHARRNLDWKAQFDIAIDPEKARRIHRGRKSSSGACSMCGELCAIKIMRDTLKRHSRSKIRNAR